MTEEIVGSKFKPNNGYGQNGFTGPSSTTPKEPVPHYASVASTVKPKDPVLTDPDVRNWETRGVSAAPIKPSFGMRNPNANPAKIPSGTNRHASSIIAPRGNARR
jgi:hypothetical protein